MQKHGYIRYTHIAQVRGRLTHSAVSNRARRRGRLSHIVDSNQLSQIVKPSPRSRTRTFCNTRAISARAPGGSNMATSALGLSAQCSVGALPGTLKSHSPRFVQYIRDPDTLATRPLILSANSQTHVEGIVDTFKDHETKSTRQLILSAI